MNRSFKVGSAVNFSGLKKDEDEACRSSSQVPKRLKLDPGSPKWALENASNLVLILESFKKSGRVFESRTGSRNRSAQRELTLYFVNEILL